MCVFVICELPSALLPRRLRGDSRVAAQFVNHVIERAAAAVSDGRATKLRLGKYLELGVSVETPLMRRYVRRKLVIKTRGTVFMPGGYPHKRHPLLLARSTIVHTVCGMVPCIGPGHPMCSK